MAAPTLKVLTKLRSKFILRKSVTLFQHLTIQPIANSFKGCTSNLFSTFFNFSVHQRNSVLRPSLTTIRSDGDCSSLQELAPRLGNRTNMVGWPSTSLRRDTCCYQVRFCHSSSVCWNCQSSLPNIGVNYFCDSCKVIQPCQEGLDYFQRMNLPRTFEINTKELTQTFRNFQRLLHPDKFSQKSSEEQQFSAEQSSAVNKAYSTLLKPLNRGLYLLELLEHPIEEGDSMVDNEFLMTMMELNEELSDTSNLEKVKKIGEENNKKIILLMKELSELFKTERLNEARDILAKLKYFTNIDDKVKEKLGTSVIE